MKSLNFQEFNLIFKELQSKIIGCRINNITLVNSRDFILACSMVKNEKLLISLNHSAPFVGLLRADNIPSTIVGATNDALRKYIKDAFIVDISLLNNDRILKFELQKANELYEKEKFFVYIECIPQRPNLVVTNDKNIIIFAMHYSSLTSSRSIVKNFEYMPPESKLSKQSEDIKNIDAIKKLMEDYYQSCIQTRSQEKYLELFKFLKIRVKSLSKKLLTLDKSDDEANEKLSYQEIGSMILAYSYNKEELNTYIAENNLDFDEKLSAGQNAEKYFKKYKKAKRTIEMNQIEKEKTKSEIENLNFILNTSTFMSEDELLSLAKQYVPNKFKTAKLKKEPTFIGVINYNGTKISFGKNAKANNELTFKLAKKDEFYAHIKDTHGAHVIIHSSNPTNDEILAACEIALKMSNREDGDVYYTEVRNVKKGSSLGEAILLNYKVATIKNIRESTISLLNK